MTKMYPNKAYIRVEILQPRQDRAKGDFIIVFKVFILFSPEKKQLPIFTMAD